MIFRNLLTKESLLTIGLVLSLIITLLFAFLTVQGWEFAIPNDPFIQVAAVIDTPISSPSPSPDFTATITLSPIVETTPVLANPYPEATELIQVSGFFDAILKEVIHIENGKATLIKIKTSAEIEGRFYAELATPSSMWEYICTIYKWNQKYLFCFGDKLPDREQAIIYVFQESDVDEEQVLVYAVDFIVPVLFNQTK